jgi:hypothetical protein
MLINYLRLPSISTPLFTIPFFPDSSRINDLLPFSAEKLSALASNIKAFTDVVLIQKPDLPWNTIPQYGAIYKFSLPFSVFGIFCLFKLKKTGGLILIWLLVSLFCGLLINDVNVNRINIIYYPLIIATAIGIQNVWELIGRKFVKIKKPVLLFLCWAYILAFAGFTRQYFTTHNAELSKQFYSGFFQSLNVVKQHDFPVIITTNTQYHDAVMVTEILTLFGVSAKPMQPNTQYSYSSFEEPPTDMHCAYVMRESEVSLLPASRFTFYRFDDYTAALPIN